MDVMVKNKVNALMALVLAVLVGMVMIVLGLLMVFAKTVVLVMASVKKRRRNVTVILDGWVKDVKNKWIVQCLVIKRVVGTGCASTDVATVVQVTKSIQIVAHQIHVQEIIKVNYVIVMVSV